MKQLVSTAVNFMLAPTESVERPPVGPLVEVVNIVGEPGYRFDGKDELVKTRLVETQRFIASPKAIRQVAEMLLKSADAADALHTEATGGAKPEEKK
jgi:hypothetical protein